MDKNDLLVIFSAHTPKLMYNGQIRMECPFRENHDGVESTGDGSKSFFATPDRNTYHCFSCGAKGRLSILLNQRFDVPYFDALSLVSLTKDDAPKKVETFELDTKWDIVPPKYFLERGFKPSTLNHFRVGTMLDEKKHEIICIPFFDKHELKGIKYRINYPDRFFWYSPGFRKGDYLYNNGNYPYAIAVEGETDVWRLYEYGYNVVSTLTTSVTEMQLELLSKFPILYLAYDTDAPGVRAMKKIYDALHMHTEIRFINYPAKDPDKCRKRFFDKAFKNYCNYAEFKMLAL